MAQISTRFILAAAISLGLTGALLAPRPVLGQDAAAAAPETPLVLDYATFEATVPHADLTDCPAALAGPDRFCRMTLAAETIGVWVFSLNGDQPLLALQTYDVEETDIAF
ncbi:hypothetical protein ACEYYB_00735 [Paracoccus sp. p4-l81]|uniref:hypothetical protein n=1 Tax=unclassified Paracoccus (in: a-proteobacteria) TaxID=2688777 RepID=UPI0035BA3FAE